MQKVMETAQNLLSFGVSDLHVQVWSSLKCCMIQYTADYLYQNINLNNMVLKLSDLDRTLFIPFGSQYLYKNFQVNSGM